MPHFTEQIVGVYGTSSHLTTTSTSNVEVRAARKPAQTFLATHTSWLSTLVRPPVRALMR